MQCPIDGSTLVMSDKQGIEIDYCPQCRGVWLDRGEIDKIVERSVGGPAPAAAPASYSNQPQRPANTRRDHDDDDDHHDYRHDSHNGGHNQHKRKESWLGDLFD